MHRITFRLFQGAYFGNRSLAVHFGHHDIHANQVVRIPIRLRQTKSIDCLFAINGYVALPYGLTGSLHFHAFRRTPTTLSRSRLRGYFVDGRSEPKCIGLAISADSVLSQHRHT